HRTDPVPSPRQLNPGVPRSIEGIIMKSLQKQPGERYRTASDLLNDLKSVRDALRFGKPLSWTPVETEPQPVLAAARKNEPSKPAESRPAVALETLMPTAPDREYSPKMSTTTTSDDRIHPLLKFALAVVTATTAIALIVFTVVWMTMFSKPPEKA